LEEEEEDIADHAMTAPSEADDQLKK